ncbi:MAG: hypothetical protein AABW64_01765 [Nanoarchaeota archaeon]
MKRAQFNWAHFTVWFVIAAFFLTVYIMTYRIHEGKNFLDTHEEKTVIEDMIFFDRLSHHCFSPSSFDGARRVHESFDLHLFTQENLAACVPLQSRVTLTPLFEGDAQIITSSDSPSFQPDTGQRTLVFVEHKPYILEMELHHA